MRNILQMHRPGASRGGWRGNPAACLGAEQTRVSRAPTATPELEQSMVAVGLALASTLPGTRITAIMDDTSLSPSLDSSAGLYAGKGLIAMETAHTESSNAVCRDGASQAARYWDGRLTLIRRACPSPSGLRARTHSQRSRCPVESPPFSPETRCGSILIQTG